jgi:multicomponent Na+:H+ antiporter subunit A
MGVTLTIGATIFWFWDPLHRALEEPVRKLARLGLAAQYEKSLSWIPTTAAASTRTIQHGRAPGYMTLCLTASTIAIGAALWAGAAQLQLPQWNCHRWEWRERLC